MSKYVGDIYEFDYGTSDVNNIFIDEKINTTFMLTRHDTHSNFVLESLKNGKNVL